MRNFLVLWCGAKGDKKTRRWKSWCFFQLSGEVFGVNIKVIFQGTWDFDGQISKSFMCRVTVPNLFLQKIQKDPVFAIIICFDTGGLLTRLYFPIDVDFWKIIGCSLEKLDLILYKTYKKITSQICPFIPTQI